MAFAPVVPSAWNAFLQRVRPLLNSSVSLPAHLQSLPVSITAILCPLTLLTFLHGTGYDQTLSLL